MKDLTTIGIDIAKNFMQIHGADIKGKTVLKKRVPRAKFLAFMANLPHGLIGMEACSGAHYWATKLIDLGFEVKLMSPRKVKMYVENHKNDEKDAQACAEAVTRANMTFVPIKNQVQLEIQSIHRVRSYYVKQRTALMNMMRGLLIEMGIAIAKGQASLMKQMQHLLYGDKEQLNEKSKSLFADLYEQLKQLNHAIEKYTASLEKLSEEDIYSKRICSIAGVGPITATAVIAKIGNGSEFRQGRELSAYLGIVPKQHSSGEKNRLGKISKHGDRYLRQLVIHGGRSSILAAMRKHKITGMYIKTDTHSQWIRRLVERVGKNKAAVAVANKNVRIMVALLKHETMFESALAH